jgi:hypothetical protein
VTLAVIDTISLVLAIAGTLIAALGSALLSLLIWVATRLVRLVDRLTQRVEAVEIEQARIRTEMTLTRPEP